MQFEKAPVLTMWTSSIFIYTATTLQRILTSLGKKKEINKRKWGQSTTGLRTDHSVTTSAALKGLGQSKQEIKIFHHLQLVWTRCLLRPPLRCVPSPLPPASLPHPLQHWVGTPHDNRWSGRKKREEKKSRGFRSTPGDSSLPGPGLIPPTPSHTSTSLPSYLEDSALFISSSNHRHYEIMQTALNKLPGSAVLTPQFNTIPDKASAVHKHLLYGVTFLIIFPTILSSFLCHQWMLDISDCKLLVCTVFSNTNNIKNEEIVPCHIFI